MLPFFASILAGCNGGSGKLIGDHGEDHWVHYKNGGMFFGGTPSMSPDGSRVLFCTPCSGRGDVVQINRDGTGAVKLAGTSDYEADPIYSPDGARIAYVREHDGDRHIWIMNSDGTGQTQLTFGHLMDDLVCFSADGSQILFDRSLHIRGGGRFAEPYVMRSDGGNVERRLEKPAGIVKDGVASPDGKRMYYTSRPYARELCVSNADGSGERVLPAPGGYKTPPRLSPDARTLLICVYTRGQRKPNIALLDVASEEVVALIPDGCETERTPGTRARDQP